MVMINTKQVTGENRVFSPINLSDFFTQAQEDLFLSLLESVSNSGYGKVVIEFSNGRARFLYEDKKFDLMNPTSWPKE